MKINTIVLQSYQIPLTTGLIRSGVLVQIVDQQGQSGWGEIAPLPLWSEESLKQSIDQLAHKKQAILEIEWTADSCLKKLAQLSLYPSLTFGLESALLSILMPLPAFHVSASALLMGSFDEIVEMAKVRLSEGFTSAKLKVSHLSFENASQLIHQLKDLFFLRIDVNRAWDTEDSLRFFSQFSKDAFDYVEEPFRDPKDLIYFQHPLAIDESFPKNISLKELELLPTLKALIYKPTIQGGMIGCLPLREWAMKKGVSLVLSSSFESDIGLAHVASIAHRLSLSSPIGIGTYHYMSQHLRDKPLQFYQSNVYC